MIASLEDRYDLSPYWPKEMDNDTQASRVREFEKKIYPIWAPIWSRYEEFGNGSECDNIHKCDLAIYDSEIKPAREFLAPANMELQRKKAAAGKKFGLWNDNGGSE